MKTLDKVTLNDFKAELQRRLRELKSGSEEIFPISVGDLAIELIGQPDTLLLDINLEDNVTIRNDNGGDAYEVSIYDIFTEDLDYIVDIVGDEIGDNNK